jgi:hypothetical protein
LQEAPSAAEILQVLQQVPLRSNPKPDPAQTAVPQPN